tara:strand:- start:907 stop:2166 length:1260 start_codon:yes stop_codon:yes gene_type:complete
MNFSIRRIYPKIYMIIIGLLISEILLLFFLPIFPLPTDNLINKSGESVYAINKQYHHDYRSSQEFFRYPTNLDEFKPVYNKINSLGLRGEEISTKDSARVLLLGDSFIEAEEVDEQYTVGNLLNKKFRGELEVIQKGVSSWSPLLELNWLLKIGFSLDPDHIVLFIVPNDFFGLSYSRSDASYAKVAKFNDQGDPVSFEVSSTQDRTIFEKQLNKLQLFKLLKNIYVHFKGLNKNYSFRSIPVFKQFSQQELDELLLIPPDTVRETLDERLDVENTVKDQVKESICLSRSNELWDIETKSNVDLSMKFLLRIKEHCSDRNIKLSILYVPFGWNIDLKETSLARKHFHMENAILPLGGIETEIKDFCSENKVEYLDFATYIQGLNSEKLLYYRSDPHWGPDGHRAVADFLFSKLTDNKNG